MPRPARIGEQVTNEPGYVIVDLLISCSIPRYIRPNHSAFEPNISSRLSALFGFDHALAFDVANGCAGMFSAIRIAHSLMKACLATVALIVCERARP